MISKRKASWLPKSHEFVTMRMVSDWLFELKDAMVNTVGCEHILDLHPRRIFNMDETSFQLQGAEQRVTFLGEKGADRLHYHKPGTRQFVTTVFCGSADGDLLPPFILIPGVNEGVPSKESIYQDKIDGAGFWKTAKGWMTANCFVEWLRWFNNWLTDNNIVKPVLLVLDGLKTHVTITAARYAADNGIRMFLLVAYASAMSQPLDIAWMEPAKKWFNKAVLDFQVKNGNVLIQKKNFPIVLRRMLRMGYKADSIKNGFRKAGIYPFDPLMPYNNASMYSAKDGMKRIEEQKKKLSMDKFKLVDPYQEVNPLAGVVTLPEDLPEGTEAMNAYWVLQTVKDGRKSRQVTRITPEALDAISLQRSAIKVKMTIISEISKKF